jgi:hypothetical protein
MDKSATYIQLSPSEPLSSPGKECTVVEPSFVRSQDLEEQKVLNSLKALIQSKVNFLQYDYPQLEVDCHGNSLDHLMIYMRNGDSYCWEEIRRISGVCPIIQDALRLIR